MKDMLLSELKEICNNSMQEALKKDKISICLECSLNGKCVVQAQCMGYIDYPYEWKIEKVSNEL